MYMDCTFISYRKESKISYIAEEMKKDPTAPLIICNRKYIYIYIYSINLKILVFSQVKSQYFALKTSLTLPPQFPI